MHGRYTGSAFKSASSSTSDPHLHGGDAHKPLHTSPAHKPLHTSPCPTACLASPYQTYFALLARCWPRLVMPASRAASATRSPALHPLQPTCSARPTPPHAHHSQVSPPAAGHIPSAPYVLHHGSRTPYTAVHRTSSRNLRRSSRSDSTSGLRDLTATSWLGPPWGSSRLHGEVVEQLGTRVHTGEVECHRRRTYYNNVVK